MNKTWKAILRTACVALIAGAMLGSAAGNAAAGISDVFLHVEATAGDKTDSWEIKADDINGWEDGHVSWQLPTAVEFRANGDLLGTLDSVSAYISLNPQVLLNFSVTAGNVDTMFTFTSTVVSFAPLIDPPAVATAAITVTDTTGNGATLTGGYLGGNTYSADTNLGNYATIVPGVIAGPFSSNVSTQTVIGPITGSVTSISSEFKFTLSAYDAASGTSNFDVVPEPASMIALGTGLAGFFGMAARRRKS